MIDVQKQVFLYCENNHDHWNVAIFAGGVHGAIWTAVDGIGPTPKNLLGVGGSRSTLAGDQRLSASQAVVSRTPDQEPLRTRWHFRCKKCGLSVETRQERLSPILDTLVEGGVAEITLRALAARLRMR